MIEYGDVFLTTLLLLIADFLAWCFAAWLLSSLVRRETRKGLRLTLYLSFPFLAIVTGIALWQLAVSVQIAVTGLNLLSARYYLVLIFLLVPVGFTWVWSLPEIWKLVHSVPREGLVTDPKMRARFVAPHVAVPAQMGIPAAFLAHGTFVSVAFKADNPGVWMDHCHNLIHASQGFVMHLLYENVMTHFKVGKETRNKPD